MKKDYSLTFLRIVNIISILFVLGSLAGSSENSFKDINAFEIIFDFIIICNVIFSFKIIHRDFKEKDKLCFYLDTVQNFLSKNNIDDAIKIINIAKQEESYKEYEYYHK